MPLNWLSTAAIWASSGMVCSFHGGHLKDRVGFLEDALHAALQRRLEELVRQQPEALLGDPGEHLGSQFARRHAGADAAVEQAVELAGGAFAGLIGGHDFAS